MKHLAPQPEFSIPDEPFTLTTQAAIDGDRVAKEKQQSTDNQQQSEQQQTSLTL